MNDAEVEIQFELFIHEVFMSKMNDLLDNMKLYGGMYEEDENAHEQFKLYIYNIIGMPNELKALYYDLLIIVKNSIRRPAFSPNKYLESLPNSIETIRQHIIHGQFSRSEEDYLLVEEFLNFYNTKGVEFIKRSIERHPLRNTVGLYINLSEL